VGEERRTLPPTLTERPLGALLGAALLLAGGCASVAPAPWPPGAGEPRHTVIVSVDTWHAMIALPLAGGPSPRFEEWGYAEQAWYLEGRQGVGGALRALLTLSAAVVEVTVSERLWAERTPQPPADVFTFEIGTEGHERLRAYLRETLAGDEPVAVLGDSRFYRARRAYHVFHQCHQYAAAALRAAGLPLWPAAALTRGLLALQLRGVERQGRAPAYLPAPYLAPPYLPGDVAKSGH